MVHALEPAALELSLQAVDDLRKERERVERHWRQQLERARVEAESAERQYRAVEPEHRLVARSLEQRWEAALAEVRRLEEVVARVARDRPARLTEAERSDANKVRGCASQVWMVTEPGAGGALGFRGDSDAHIVRGLIAILFAMVQGKSAAEILALDPAAAFEQLGLKEHLTPQRSNGFVSMVERIRADARAAAAHAS